MMHTETLNTQVDRETSFFIVLPHCRVSISVDLLVRVVLSEANLAGAGAMDFGAS